MNKWEKIKLKQKNDLKAAKEQKAKKLQKK